MKLTFKSNNCIGIKVNDLNKAENFYGNVMGFKLMEKSGKLISFDTGHFILYVEKNENLQSPVPSFSVDNVSDTKDHLIKNGCEIVWETHGCFWFKDPFGIVYDVIQI